MGGGGGGLQHGVRFIGSALYRRHASAFYRGCVILAPRECVILAPRECVLSGLGECVKSAIRECGEFAFCLLKTRRSIFQGLFKDLAKKTLFFKDFKGP